MKRLMLLVALSLVDAQTVPIISPTIPPNSTTAIESEVTSTTTPSGSSETAATAPAVTSVVEVTMQAIPSTITGISFFDSNNNGFKDANLDYAISSIAVSLYTCDPSDINFGLPLEEATTDFSGVYKFENILPGEYKIGIGSIPSWYTFSSAWTGATDSSGVPSYPDATSVIDPATSQSDCFTVPENMVVDAKDFGMRLNVPELNAPATPSPTPGLTVGGTEASGVTPNPTSPPTARETEAEIGNSFTDAPTSTIAQVPGATPSPDDSSIPQSLAPTHSPPTVSPSAGITYISTVDKTTVPSRYPSVAPTEQVSDIPSAFPSTIPSSLPSEKPSTAPSMAPTFTPSLATTETPTTPTKIGDLIGPVMTTGLQMTFDGIGLLENDTAWAEYTSSYIMNYFSVGYNVWDVDVSINVNEQTSSRRLRKLQQSQPTVVVTYDQTTTYKTDDGTDATTIATEPFLTSLDRARYRIYLADQSKYYKNVTEVSSVTIVQDDVHSPSEGNDPSPTPTPEPSGISPVIIGVCVAVGAFLLLGGLYLMYVRRDRGDDYYDDSVDDDEYAPSGSMGSGRRRSHDLEVGSRASRSSSRQGSRQGSRYGDDE